MRASFWVSNVGTIASSTGGPTTEGVGDSACARRRGDAATKQRNAIADRNFTSATVEATPESTSGNLMAFEKAMNFLRQFGSDPFGCRDLLHRRFPQPVYRAKFSQKQI